VRYWLHPIFWLRLVLMEIGACVLTALALVIVSVGCKIAGTTEHFWSASCYVVGVPVWVFVSCVGFRDVRNDVRKREEAGLRGFEVIPVRGPDDAG
jgi:hypothetical protein